MITIDLKATGDNIKRLRDVNGLTNMDLQNAFGFNTQQALFKWFRGDALPTVDNLVILADLFGVTVDQILVTRRVIETMAA